MTVAELVASDSVLGAMITPAVLMSACGTLVFSTSARLGRVVDRVRVLSERIEELAKRKDVTMAQIAVAWVLTKDGMFKRWNGDVLSES